MNVRNTLKVGNMQVNVQFLQQLQPEWNANLLVLITATQHYPDTYSPDTYYQAPKSQKTHAPSSRKTPSTKTHATTRNTCKEIAKPVTPPSQSASKEDNDEEQAHMDKQIQKSLAFIAKHFKNIYKPTNNNLRTSSNTRNKNVDTYPRTGNDIFTG
ncbi:hypothetical protein Tco_0539595 [Tanacetum coccineum]